VTLTEYVCDMPGCPNLAEHVLGVIRELRVMAVVCAEHKRQIDEESTR
jgi:hypothetical protein